jgi:2-methylisocitrate lyase-like PEP mutase family enzyme
MTQADTDWANRARLFASLHRPGEPVVLFNIWDAGSAKAVAEAGAKAVATGSHSVAEALGFPDGQGLPIALALENAERVVRAVDLPVTVDFEGAYAVEPEGVAANVARLAATGAIGCNFEDQVIGGEGLHPVELQAARIRAARAAAGEDFFLNARTDVFLKAPRDRHDSAMADEAIARGRAYADAGASGFFVPGLIDLDLLGWICASSPLPVNYIAVPGGPSSSQVAAAGVARISHGPFPYRRAMAALKQWAEEAHG